MPQSSAFQEFQDNGTSGKIIVELTRKWQKMGLEVNNPAEKCFLFAIAARFLLNSFSSKPPPPGMIGASLISWIDYWSTRGIKMPILRATLPEIFEMPLPQSIKDQSNTPRRGTDVFEELYQQLFPHSIRFARGEFFTPQALANEIVTELKILQKPDVFPHIVDPACGTGVFLVACYREVLESSLSDQQKNACLRRIVGFDINPFSVELARVNLLLLLSNTALWKDPSPINVQVMNTLKELHAIEQTSGEPFDILIGNPPWGSLARLTDPDLRAQMVAVAKRLDIQAPIQANNELAAIFMDLCVEKLLWSKGRVAMVLPRTILESSSLDKWRVLRPYQEIEFLFIDESVFPIPGVVFFARKASLEKTSVEKYRISVAKLKWKRKGASGQIIEKSNPEWWVPYHIDWDKSLGHIRRVRKWVPEASLSTPVKRSGYYDLAEKGANIGPITFISVIPTESLEQDLVEFGPDLVGGKAPFSTPPYSIATAERRYIFPYVKSKDLIPFSITLLRHCFLPVKEIGGHLIRDDNLAPFAALHWEFLAHCYANLRPLPPDTDLFSHYLNHKHHFESPKMLARFKVVFNEGGQRVKAALLRAGELIEHTLVFVPMKSEEEGLYLTGILNSDYITDFFSGVGGRGSARHVSLRALEFPIPPYAPADPQFGPLQQRIIEAARSLEKSTRDLVQASPKSYTGGTIEKRQRAQFPELWEELNSAVVQLFPR
jgi:predicted RNA methylase